MNVMNCRSCGRLFNAMSNERVCPACRAKLDEKFDQVKEYLREHTAASVEEVSRENEVSVKQIKQWIREERLAFSEGSLEGIECENCGKLIRTGRFCEACKNKMASNLMSAYSSKQAPTPAPSAPRRSGSDRDRMRYL